MTSTNRDKIGFDVELEEELYREMCGVAESRGITISELLEELVDKACASDFLCGQGVTSQNAD